MSSLIAIPITDGNGLASVLLPAPVGGLNRRDNEDVMPPTDAIDLLNAIPRSNSIELRQGYTSVSSNTGTPQKLISDGVSNLLLYTTTGTRNALTGASFSTRSWTQNMQAVLFKGRVYAVDGQSGAEIFHNGSISQLTTSFVDSTITTPPFDNVTTHAGRLWFCDAVNQRLFYGAPDVVTFNTTNQLSTLDLSGLLNRGGRIVNIFSASVDGGEGIQDILIAISQGGDLLAFQGSNPTSSSWRFLGAYQFARPIHPQAFTELGGDVVVATTDGYRPVLQTMQQDRATATIFSDKINLSVRGGLAGSQLVIFPEEQILIAQAPDVQHVMNVTTGAWSEWNISDAKKWAVHNGTLYFTDATSATYLYGNGARTDNGAKIRFDWSSAFNNLNDPSRRKSLRMMGLSVGGKPTALHFVLGVDYVRDVSTNQLSQGTEPPAATWNISDWNIGLWAGSGVTKRRQIGVSATGHNIAIGINGTTDGRFIWTSTTLSFQPLAIT